MHDLVIHPREDLMIAATHGRGMFALDVRPLQGLTPAVVASAAHLLGADAGALPAGGRGGFGGFNAQSAVVHYWLGADANVTLEIQDASGAVVNVLEARGRAGLHQVEWGLDRMGGNQGGRGGGGFFRRANLVPEGTYQAVLTVNGVEHRSPVVVRRD